MPNPEISDLWYWETEKEMSGITPERQIMVVVADGFVVLK